MSVDEHSAIIEQLKPLLMEPNFQELFQQLTADESNSTRFLLKMELNRLASPCTRILDLRDKSELPCEQLQMGQQTHFLDQPAKEAFEEALALYRGTYTLGVYEHVLNVHKQRKLAQRQGPTTQAQTEDAPFLVPGVVLGSYFHRCEERMNYSIRISAEQPNRPAVAGITVDLSVGGARVRLPAKLPFAMDKPLRVKLLELGEEYYYEDLQNGVDYEIVDIQTSPEYTWLRLKRTGGTEALAEMLANLIRGYKYRYKVDVNDIYVSASGLGFERHYLPHLPHLPLFVEKIEEQAVASHLLLGRENQRLLHYFLDEQDINQLPGMLTPARLSLLLSQTEDPDHGLFFCFTHSAQGRTYFYSATLAELKQAGALPLFFGFGAGKISWRVFRLLADKIDHGIRYKASVLPGDNDNYSPLVEQQLGRFSHVLQLMDLTDEAAKTDYQAWFNQENANALKPFGQPKIKENRQRTVSLQFTERRQESRYAFKTQVELCQERIIFSGSTHDVSCRGMQITLNEPLTLDPTKPIMLSLPRLQPLAGKTELTELPYRLVKTRKKGMNLHLAAIMGHTPHVGVEFMHKLIASNKDKLEKLTENNNEIKELADGLKNIFMRRLHGVPYFIEKTAKSVQIASLGINTEHNEITDIFAALSSEAMHFNLSPLMGEGRFKRDIMDPIRRMKFQQDLDYFEVYIQLLTQSRGQFHIKCLAASQLPAREDRLAFIRQGQLLGRFLALRVYYGMADKVDLSYIRREREYIGVHAAHKAKLLDEKLRSIIGVGELLDISREVILRYPELQA
jgi:hypothetical protein